MGTYKLCPKFFFSALGVYMHPVHPWLRLCSLSLSLYVCMFVYVCVSDVDECLEHLDSCAFRCQNIPGSFHCLCPKGFELAADGRHCEGNSEWWQWRLLSQSIFIIIVIFVY